MKRILMSGIICAVSIFFTGCSPLLNSGGGKFTPLEWDIAETGTDNKEMPDYYELNSNTKYEDLTAKRAFKFADTHSEAAKDITSFEIGTLLDGGTFIYGYSTREAGNSSDDTRKYVHCAAAYQYETGRFHVIHENEYSRAEVSEDRESFYLQICDRENSSEPSVFVYDNGIGYLYKLDGTLEFSTDIEGSVRSYFSKAYSVSVTNAMTDGANRIYVELTIEKTAIDLSEGTEGNENMSEDDADKAAEELEKETDDKTVELVLFYDFTELDSNTTIDQTNAALDAQIKAWQNITKGKTYTAEPNARTDWTTASTRVPSQWKITFFDYITMDSKAKSWLDKNKIDYSTVSSNDMPILIWKNGPVFGSFDQEGYVCNFQPKKGTFQGYTNLRANKKLENVFIPLNGQYYEVHGTTGDKLYYYDSVIASRNYTYQYYTTTTDSTGKQIQKTNTETRTQKLTVHRKRYAKVISPYLEGYGTLKSQGIDHVIGVANNQVLCQKEKKLYWLKQDDTISSAGISIGEDYLVDLAEDGGKLYYLVSTPDNLIVVEQKNGSTSKWLISNEKLNVDETDLYETSSAIDQAYVSAFENATSGQSSWTQIASHQFQKTSIQADNSVLQQLSAEGVDISKCKAEGEGFLLTTFQNGLLFYDLDAGLAVNLDAGTWYGTWKNGDKFVSVGFENNDASYNTLDVAFARVKEYDLNEFYKESLENLLANARSRNEQLEAEQAQTIQESIAASSAAEENKETVEDMMDTWETRAVETDADILESRIQELIN